MNEERTEKLYAGQMGMIAVLVNVLVDKGIITESELRERFEQAHEAASRCSGGPVSRSYWRTFWPIWNPRGGMDEREVACS
jgi:hypothetical protein